GAYGITRATETLTFSQGLTSPVASETPSTQVMQAQAPAGTQGSVQTAQVESTPVSQPQNFEYEVSLANGFLKKAVTLSNATETQTVEEKDMIVQLLNQALEAANRAIGMNPNDSSGYTSRGRIYQTTSVIKPEMKLLADQDFAKASTLGALNPTQATSTKNPMDLLPTEQAAGNFTAMIAGPEDKTKTTIQGETEKNATRGTVILDPSKLDTSKNEVFVSYPQVKDTTQLYVTAEKNPENLTLYVKNKEAGNGFTIASTATPNSPLDITWWEIE
ncbi:MAG: hypothetical protein AAB612_00640, partial [Patescibacteria group bacterium]